MPVRPVISPFGRQATRVAALLVLVVLGFVAAAQAPLRIGVVLPDRATTTSANWNEVLAARAWEQDRDRQSSGMPVELHFRDGGTTPANTVAAIRDLVEQEGVHAVVCCVTPVSADSLAEFVGTLPILSIARPLGEVAEGGPLVLSPGPLALARAMSLDARRFGRGVGLMTLENDYGREIASAVLAGLLEAGLPLAHAEDFPPGAPVLTPEALLVAASEPAAVIVWGLAGDTATAVEALRARGYEGPVYLPWTLARDLPAAIRTGRSGEILVAAPPVAVADSLPQEHPNAPAVARYRSTLARAYGAYEASPEGALAFDALELLLAAGELATVYGVDPSSTAPFRQALRDALVALAPMSGAAGSYDYDGGRNELALARGLVVVIPDVRGFTPAGQ